MKRKLSLLPATLFLLFCIQPHGQADKQGLDYHALFKKAEQLFINPADENSDSLALTYFEKVAANTPLNSSNALLLYNCYERIGILQQGLESLPGKALQQFYISLDIHKTFHLADSILFRLLLSAGNEHYQVGLFDSSVYYFSWAEKIIGQYPSSGHAEDLYNSLGALYSESGDYTQSKIYFSKALEIIRKTRPDLKEAVFAMSLNIASALRLLGKLDSAIVLYKKLLQPEFPQAPVLNNLGRIYLAENKPDSALYFLRRGGDVSGLYAIAYNNSLALAMIQKKDTIEAAKYLNSADSIYRTTTKLNKNNFFGTTCKYRGDLQLMQHQPNEALKNYQRAIIQFCYKFNDENIYANPENFAGGFASYNLFEALTAKAKCFALLYSEEKSSTHFNAAKNTFDKAFLLADYIKKSMSNDEARLFIADKVFEAYQFAVDFILTREDQQQDKNILITALKWISKSRATSLAINLKEQSIKKFAGLPDSLLSRENNLNITITRLQLQLEQAADTTTVNNLISAINTEELKLHNAELAFQNYPSYYKQKFESDSIDLRNIQKNILDNNTAILCYFAAERSMHVFVIKKSVVIHSIIANDSAITFNIKNFTAHLHGLQNGTNNDDTSSKFLYNALVSPISTVIDGVSSLIIIPDQEFIGVPFEALQMTDGKYLLEKYACTYQYALPFVQKNSSDKKFSNELAMAPFANEVKNKFSNFAPLPFSKNEISVFDRAAQIQNENASRQYFLLHASGASIIHLATHAVVDYDEPSRSYIAFYPANNADSSYKLYAQELYNLSLPNAQLIFLSACETGSGKLSQSEGALSITRAFAFAGCPNIVTSLWKAEDISTAYISKKFYEYLFKGYGYAHALQQAKIDLLNDASMSQYHAPQYWSHLVFIGNTEETKSYTLIWIVLFSLFFIALLFFVRTKMKLKISKR